MRNKRARDEIDRRAIIPLMRYKTVTDLAKAIGYTRFAVYGMIKRGIIRTEKVGQWLVIPLSDYNRAVEIMANAKPGTKPFYGMGKGFKRVKQIPKKQISHK